MHVKANGKAYHAYIYIYIYYIYGEENCIVANNNEIEDYNTEQHYNKIIIDRRVFFFTGMS